MRIQFFYFFPDVDIVYNYIEIASLLILNTVLYKMLVFIINRLKKFYSKISNFRIFLHDRWFRFCTKQKVLGDSSLLYVIPIQRSIS